jgi:hypothetical protein
MEGDNQADFLDYVREENMEEIWGERIRRD